MLMDGGTVRKEMIGQRGKGFIVILVELLGRVDRLVQNIVIPWQLVHNGPFPNV